MRFLCAVHLLVLLSLGGDSAHSAALNGRLVAAAATTGNNGHTNVKRERNALKLAMRNILNKHAANSQLNNLQSSLAGVRPAAAILCNGNDIGIEFDLNDQFRLPTSFPAQSIYTTFESDGDGGGGGHLVETAAANIYCSDESDEGGVGELLPQRPSETPPMQWDVAAGDGVRHFDYGQIAAPPHVSVHQYGTNYFQHNSYTMPLTSTSTSTSTLAPIPAADSTPESDLVASSTPSLSSPLPLSPPKTAILSSLPQNSLSIEPHANAAAAQPNSSGSSIPTQFAVSSSTASTMPTNESHENTTTPQMMMVVTVAPILATDTEEPIENIFIIQRNRTKKDKETNKRNATNTLRCQTVVSVNMSGNGKPVNLTSSRPRTNGSTTGLVALAVATTTARPHTPNTPQHIPQQGRQTQRILNTEIHGRHNDNGTDRNTDIDTETNNNTTTNVADEAVEGAGQFVESQFKANSITTKRSIDYLMSNRHSGADITPTLTSTDDEADIVASSVTQSSQDDLDEQQPQLEIIAYNSNVKASTTRSRYDTTTRPFTSHRSTIRGKLQPTMDRLALPRRNRNRTATVVYATGKPRRPAETNYYYYYTKPTLTIRNRQSKPARIPTRPYVEPIAHEALDSEFMAAKSMAMSLPLPSALPLAPPPSQSNHIKLADHHRKINNLRYIHAIGQRRRQSPAARGIHDVEKCQLHSGDKYILVPHKRHQLIKDIIATEQIQQRRQENNVHYYRELRPFEEPLDGQDCRDDGNDDAEKNSKNLGSAAAHTAPQRSGQSASSKRQHDNQSDYFECNDDENADEATASMPLGEGARSVP